MMNETDADVRPLSYSDLRRFLGLLTLMAISAVLIWRLADTILLFVMVLLFATVLNPVVAWLERRGVKRGLAVMLVMMLLIGVLALLVWLVVPVVLQQLNQLTQSAPQIRQSILSQFEKIADRYPAIENSLPETDAIVKAARSQAGNAAQFAFRTSMGIIGALFIFIVALLLLVFTLSDPKPLLSGFLATVPERHRDTARRCVVRIIGQMAAWIKATLINGLITGTLTGVLLMFIGVKPAFVFGILAFFGEFVPNVGPIVASAPALFVALGQGLEKGGLALAAIFAVQMLSGNVLVPLIMGKQMELHPVAITFFALGMAGLFGVAGAILAVPAAATLKVLIDEFYLRPQRIEGELESEKVKSTTHSIVTAPLYSQPELQIDTNE
jgi:predicted PurR-regulated permease PerM